MLLDIETMFLYLQQMNFEALLDFLHEHHVNRTTGAPFVVHQKLLLKIHLKHIHHTLISAACSLPLHDSTGMLVD